MNTSSELRLRIGDHSTTIEVEGMSPDIDTVINDLVRPALLALGFAPETVADALGEPR